MMISRLWKIFVGVLAVVAGGAGAADGSYGSGGRGLLGGVGPAGCRFSAPVVRCAADGAIYAAREDGLHWFSPEAYAAAGFPPARKATCAKIARCPIVSVLRAPDAVVPVVPVPQPVVPVPQPVPVPVPVPQPVVPVPQPVRVIDARARVTWYSRMSNDPPGSDACAYIPHCVPLGGGNPSSAAAGRGSPYVRGGLYTISGAGRAPFCVRLDDLCASCRGSHIDVYVGDGPGLPFDYATVSEGC